MSAPGLVTCVIPVYNGERFLAEAVESVLAQTHQPIAIVIVDDGSTDRTAEVARGFGERVRYLRQENAGPAVARNTGLAHAGGGGEFVGFLDADDLWHSEKTARQVATLTADPALEYCVTLVQNVWTEEVETEEERFRHHPRGQPIPGYVSGTLLARRAAFERIGPFNPGLQHGDDTEWFLRAREAGVAGVLLEEVLLTRRLHQTNLSRLKADSSRDEYLTLLKARLDAKRKP